MTDAPAVRLYVGGHCSRVQGEVQNLVGDRMLTAAHPAQRVGYTAAQVGAITGLLDSGAFSDPPARRLTPERALERQLRWEGHASAKWGHPWRAAGLVSYDVLIDETWTGETRAKRRWSVRDADCAVERTIEAAAYLAGQRDRLAPRTLILSCQGVEPGQYLSCAQEVLRSAAPGDWIGLGGWCVLGRYQRLLPTFWATLALVLPAVAAAGVRHVHIFGVLWRPALGGLVWLADRHGLAVSTDSTAPILACTWKDRRKAGARMPWWRCNTCWWRHTLAHLRESQWYREPPCNGAARQLGMFDGEESA